MPRVMSWLTWLHGSDAVPQLQQLESGVLFCCDHVFVLQHHRNRGAIAIGKQPNAYYNLDRFYQLLNKVLRSILLCNSFSTADKVLRSILLCTAHLY